MKKGSPSSWNIAFFFLSSLHSSPFFGFVYLEIHHSVGTKRSAWFVGGLFAGIFVNRPMSFLACLKSEKEKKKSTKAKRKKK
jgi:hypothetical protein